MRPTHVLTCATLGLLVLVALAGCDNRCHANAECPIGQRCLPLSGTPEISLCCAVALSCNGICCNGTEACISGVCESTVPPPPEPDAGCSTPDCQPPPDCAPFCPDPD